MKKKICKILLVIWIIDILVLFFLLGYYYGHYMHPNNIIRFIPYCKHFQAKLL